MTQHSPLGGSAADIFLKCDGYATVVEAMHLNGAMEDDDGSEFSREGTVAHEVAAKCLTDNLETWEFIGQVINGIEVTAEMVDAVEIHVAECRRLADVSHGETFVEHSVKSDLPNSPWQTADHVVVSESLLCLTDYKHGQGKFVEIEHCAQLMYYAYWYILKYPGVRRVVLRIIQPRIPNQEPIRRWETTAEYICQWVEDTLKPAMRRNYAGGCFKPGRHCQFCPGKIVCPALTGMFEVAMRSDTKALPYMASGHLSLNYQYIDQVRSYCSALEKEMHSRMYKGTAIPGYKLVHAQGNRIYKPGAEEAIELIMGDTAYEPRKLKSPAQLEKVSKDAKSIVTEWAHRPDAGLAIAHENDKRDAVRINSPSEVFAKALEGVVG